MGSQRSGRRPVLLVHGALATGLSDWWPVVPALARHRPVVLIDLPGHGRTGGPVGGTFLEQAAWVSTIVDRLDVGAVHLVGHSNGANVVLELLRGHPDMAMTAVVQAGNATVSPDLARMMQQLDADEIRARSPDRCAWWDRTHGPDPEGAPAWRRLLHDAATAAQAGPNLSPADLATLRMPVLVIEGAEDEVNAPFGHGRYLAEHLPDGHLWQPDGAGHDVHVHIPRRWIDVVNGFLNGRDAPSRTGPDDGVVTAGIADLRAQPSDRSERVSQLLCGDRIDLDETHGVWTRVRRHDDGDMGWVRTALLGMTTAAPSSRAHWRRVWNDHVPWTADHDGQRAGRLPFGVALQATRPTPNDLHLHVPDGSTRVVPSPGATIAATPPPTGVTLDRFEELVGVPYLWGGRSPYGFDCSGLVQQFWQIQGVDLPRNAHEQYQATFPIDGPTQRGDLVFFHDPEAGPTDPVTHVGLVLDDVRVLHAWGAVQATVITPIHGPTADRRLADLAAGTRRVARP